MESVDCSLWLFFFLAGKGASLGVKLIFFLQQRKFMENFLSPKGNDGSIPRGFLEEEGYFSRKGNFAYLEFLPRKEMHWQTITLKMLTIPERRLHSSQDLKCDKNKAAGIVQRLSSAKRLCHLATVFFCGVWNIYPILDFFVPPFQQC